MEQRFSPFSIFRIITVLPSRTHLSNDTFGGGIMDWIELDTNSMTSLGSVPMISPKSLTPMRMVPPWELAIEEIS